MSSPAERFKQGAQELTGGKVASLGKVWVRFFLLKNWPFAIIEKKFLATEQPSPFWKNSAQMQDLRVSRAIQYQREPNRLVHLVTRSIRRAHNWKNLGGTIDPSKFAELLSFSQKVGRCRRRRCRRCRRRRRRRQKKN